MIFTNFKFAKSENIKILFKINNKVYTSVDYQNRIKYLDFIGDNKNISTEIILEDFISSIIFFEYYSDTNNKIDISERILKVYNNIKENNLKNNKILDYLKNRNIYLQNLKLDLIRKSILEEIINSNKAFLSAEEDDIDLLYKFTIHYINIENDDIKNIKNEIKSLNIKDDKSIKNYLDKNKINYFYKSKEILDVDKINKNIKKNIISDTNFFDIQNFENKITYVYIKKEFETYDGLIADIYSYSVEINNNEKVLDCKKIIQNKINKEISNQEYEFSKLNNKLKDNLLEINDYVKFIDNEKIIYVVLCGLKYDKKILNDHQFSKKLNSNVSIVEKKFIKKNSIKYKLEKFYE